MARMARFAWSTLITAAGVVVASSADATGYPNTNATSPARWKFWRSTTTTGDQWISFDFGSAQSQQAWLLAHYKVHSSGGTVKAQTSPDNSTWTTQGTFSIPSPNLTNVIAIWLTNAVSARYLRIYFTNVGAASDYVEAGAIFAGTYFQPTHTLDKGYVVEVVDPSIESIAIGGQRSVVQRTEYWQVRSAVLPKSPDTDRTTISQILDTVGCHVPIFFAIDPNAPGQLIFYGHFPPHIRATVASATQPPEIDHAAPQLWDFKFDFVEDVE